MLCESSKGNARLSAISAKGVSEFLDILSGHYGDRERAATALAGLVGACVISRAVERGRPRLADQFGAIGYATQR